MQTSNDIIDELLARVNSLLPDKLTVRAAMIAAFNAGAHHAVINDWDIDDLDRYQRLEADAEVDPTGKYAGVFDGDNMQDDDDAPRPTDR